MSDTELDPFISLEPEIRCYALVGYYLNAWAVMETALNDTITKALALDSLQSVVVTKNVQYQAKIKIVRTLVEMLLRNHKRQVQHDKALISIGNLGFDRNMVAHDLFLPSSKCDGVEFLITKASGKLKMLNTHWSVQDVHDRVDTLTEATRTLKKIQSDIGIKRVSEALIAGQRKNALLVALAGLDQDTPPIPCSPDCPPQGTTDAKLPDTPQSSGK